MRRLPRFPPWGHGAFNPSYTLAPSQSRSKTQNTRGSARCCSPRPQPPALGSHHNVHGLTTVGRADAHAMVSTSPFFLRPPSQPVGTACRLAALAAAFVVEQPITAPRGLCCNASITHTARAIVRRRRLTAKATR